MRRWFLREITGDWRCLRVPLALLSLGLVAVGGCNCEEPPSFRPAGNYNPEKVLAFGKVPVSSEKTLQIKVKSTGSSGFKIKSGRIENSADATKWRFSIPPVFTGGLTPGRTSSISVTYRPCPAAWVPGPTDPMTGQPSVTNRLKDNFDYNTCSGVADSADFVTVEDGTRTGGQRIQLSGQPVQPPVADVLCQNGATMCNQPNPVTIKCVGMNFGTVMAGGSPCDMVVEVQNKWRQDKPAGDLSIERVEITVQDINGGVTRNGDDVGFTVLDMDGNPLRIDPGNPFVVHIPDDQMAASKRFKIRFAGLRTGTWFGSQQFGMTGVRLYTNDPDARAEIDGGCPGVAGCRKFNISGTGSAPDIQVFPTSLNFGSVEMGHTKTLTTTITNAGDAPLNISSLGFQQDRTGKFAWRTSTGQTPRFTILPNQRVGVRVDYTPPVAGQDADKLIIGNDDPKTMGTVQIPLTGGAVPRLKVTPSDTLVFELPNPAPPPPVPPRTLPMVLQNIGYGDLKITGLEIRGPNDETDAASIDDFTISECASMQPPATHSSCDPGLTLCPLSSPGCTMSQATIHIVYQNMHIFSIDFTQLHVRSNDPADLDHIVVFEAHDVPCLHPTPMIRVDTPRPCKGQPVVVSGRGSSAGGSPGTTVMSYEWSWLFAPTPLPDFTPPNGVQVMFTPQTSGIYLLGLDVTNSCGARSQNSASETLNVADVCN